MNSNKRFKINLISGSVLSLVIIIITTAASWVSIERLLDSQRWVERTHEVLQTLEQIISRTKDAETGQRGYLLSGDTGFLEPYEGALDDVWKGVEDLTILTIDNPSQQADLKKLSSIVTTRFALLEKSINRKRSGVAINWKDIEKGRIYMGKLRNLINVMEGRERRLLVMRTKNLEMFSMFTPIFIIVASFFAIIVTVFFYFRLSSDYHKRLSLQAQLEEKEKELSKRIEVVETFAGEVARGNYKKRIDPQELE